MFIVVRKYRCIIIIITRSITLPKQQQNELLFLDSKTWRLVEETELDVSLISNSRQSKLP